MFEVIYTRAALKGLRKIPSSHRNRVQEAIDELPKGGEKMKDREGYKKRLGKWRIIYTIQANQMIVEVIKVGPRGQVYKH